MSDLHHFHEDDNTPIQKIPYEVLEYVFSFLELRDRFKTCLVNKEWNKISWLSVRSLDVSFSSLGELPDDNIVNFFLERCPLISALKLGACGKLTDEAIEKIPRFNHTLQTLELWGDDYITDNGLRYLSQLTRLTFLDLSGLTLISSKGVQHLSGLTALTHLDLSSCKQVTTEGILHLKNLTRLEALGLSLCSNIDDSAVVSLLGMKRLAKLDLQGAKITDIGLSFFSALVSLKELSLAGCDNITGQGLWHLSTLTKLDKLMLIKNLDETGTAFQKIIEQRAIGEMEAEDTNESSEQNSTEKDNMQQNNCNQNEL